MHHAPCPVRYTLAPVLLLTLRDLAHRWVRFSVVTFLGAMVFALLFLMTGLVEQFNREPVDTVDAIGAEAWVMADGVSGPFTATATMPAAVFVAVDADDSAPVVTARTTIEEADGDETDAVLLGVVPGQLGSPAVSEGRQIAAAGETVIDTSVGLDVGDEVELSGTPFEVVGISDDTTLLAGLPLVVVPIEEAQQLAFATDEVISAVLVSGDVRSTPDGTQVVAADTVISETLEPLDGAIASIDLVRVLLWILAAIVIGAVVYLSAIDRQRDFAVLKAVGTPTRTLLVSLGLQATLVALAAVLVGSVIQLFLAPSFPLRVRVPASAYWQLPVLAVIVALVAGAVGMRKVARADPASAFAGAGG